MDTELVASFFDLSKGCKIVAHALGALLSFDKTFGDIGGSRCLPHEILLICDLRELDISDLN